MVHNIASRNGKAIPFARSKWSIDPNDVSCLDADPKFVSQTCGIELVRKPLWGEWLWFLDSEIRSVERDKAANAIVVPVPVLPQNLLLQIVSSLSALFLCVATFNRDLPSPSQSDASQLHFSI